MKYNRCLCISRLDLRKLTGPRHAGTELQANSAKGALLGGHSRLNSCSGSQITRITTRQIQIRFPRIKIARQSGEQRWNEAGLIFSNKERFPEVFFRISISRNVRILNPKNLD